MALEPYVRRHWPQAMIAWARLFAGRWRDQLVGMHVLAGIVFGIVLAVLTEAFGFLIVRLGHIPASTRIVLATLLGQRFAASALLGALLSSLFVTLVSFFLLFLLRTFLRREWLAALSFVLILTIAGALQTSGSPGLAITFRVLQYSLFLAMMLRFGILALAIGVFIGTVLAQFPITTEWSAWHAPSGWIALGVVATLSVYAFRTSLVGRPLFKDEWLDG
jgi:MFS family permease